MLGRQHNRGRAKDRVNPSSKNADFFVRVLNGEFNVSAFAAANPVTLALQDLLGPAVLDLLNVADQFLGVFGNAQEPLLDLFFHHRRAATPADTSRRLFVRQDSLFLRTPVHRRLALVRQAAFQHFEKEPLVPFVIVGPVRGDFSPPVIAHAEALHLAFHVCNILFGPLTRLDAPLDRGLLGRLAETVPADRMQDIESAQPLVPGQGVADGVVAHVAHVQKAGWIRQHLERVKLGSRIVLTRFKGTRLNPTLLPFRFDVFGKIFLVHDSSVSDSDLY